MLCYWGNRLLTKAVLMRRRASVFRKPANVDRRPGVAGRYNFEKWNRTSERARDRLGSKADWTAGHTDKMLCRRMSGSGPEEQERWRAKWALAAPKQFR